MLSSKKRLFIQEGILFRLYYLQVKPWGMPSHTIIVRSVPQAKLYVLPDLYISGTVYSHRKETFRLLICSSGTSKQCTTCFQILTCIWTRWKSRCWCQGQYRIRERSDLGYSLVMHYFFRLVCWYGPIEALYYSIQQCCQLWSSTRHRGACT